MILETNASNVVQAEYVLGGTDLISQTRSSQNDYYLTDALGSVRLMTNGVGAVTNTYRYDAFGNLVAQTGSRENSYLYTGQQFDAATGLYSLRARYYDPGAGRFLSYDTWPVDLQNPLELNRYGYGMNNPVRWRDPSGYGQGVAGYFAPVGIMGGLGTIVLPPLGSGTAGAILAMIVAMILHTLTVDDFIFLAKKPKPKNKKEKEEFERALKAAQKETEAVIDKARRRLIHDEITGQGYDYEELLDAVTRIIEDYGWGKGDDDDD